MRLVFYPVEGIFNNHWSVCAVPGTLGAMCWLSWDDGAVVRRLSVLACIVSLIIGGLGSPSRVHAQDETTWFLNEINALRAGLGLHPYVLNAQLTAAAIRQSQYLAETCNVTHTWPDGTTPSDRALQAGYTGNHVSENIYAGSNARPADAWTFWINSPIHYNGLVHGVVNEIGIGVTHGGYCGHAYTLLFGHRGDVNSPAAPPSAGNSAASAAVAAAPPVYVPPPPTNTPTPTIPTLTPSATWTITPTYTPTTTGVPSTATGTPLVLPTAPAMSPRESDTRTPVPTVADSPEPGTITPLDGQAVAMLVSPVSPESVIVTPSETSTDHDDGGIKTRDLIPVVLAFQIMLIGAVGFWYFRRER